MQYITKTDLSNGPQLGSQMSQYAGLYATSKKLDNEIVFLKEHLNDFRKVKLFDAFNINDRIINKSDIEYCTYEIKNIAIDKNVFDLDKNVNWNISGWYHLYHYWNEYRDDIKNIFSFKKCIYDTAKSNMDKIRNQENYPVVGIHFRRGDYLQVSSLNLDLDYYNDAISIFLQKFNYFKLLVFSDDIDWCKNTIIGENVYYSENNTNYVDMCMMTICDHLIIANSSFSWWGAYLNDNENKMIVCPEDYIGSSDIYHQFINKNYYPKDWIALKI